MLLLLSEIIVFVIENGELLRDDWVRAWEYGDYQVIEDKEKGMIHLISNSALSLNVSSSLVFHSGSEAGLAEVYGVLLENSQPVPQQSVQRD